MADYGVTWDDECLADLVEIFGDLLSADDAIHAIDWRLNHNPHGPGTWDLSPEAGIRLTWLRPHRGFPAVAFSYRVEVSGSDAYRCIVLRARPANLAASS